VILDLDLGDGNTEQGKRLLSALRQAPALSQAYVCVLSVHVSLEENAGNREMKSIKEEVRQRGAHLVLHKEQILTGANPDAAKLVSLWPKGSEPLPMKLPRVLVLEDSEGDIDLYKEALKGRAECLFLSPVRPSRDLMKTIRTFDPALIIVDLMLGGEKEQKYYPGARIIKAIREDPQLKRMRIVACSKYINPLETDPDAPDVPRGAIDKALAKTGPPEKPGFPTADDLLSPLEA
jgi:CheY-like chemotaxis protein